MGSKRSAIYRCEPIATNKTHQRGRIHPPDCRLFFFTVDRQRHRAWRTNQVKTAIWTRAVFLLTRLPTPSGKKPRRFASTMLVHTGFYCKSAVSRTQTDGCTAPLFLTTRDHARFSVIQALDSAVPGDDSLRTPSSRPSALQMCVDLRSRLGRGSPMNALAARYRPGRTSARKPSVGRVQRPPRAAGLTG